MTTTVHTWGVAIDNGDSTIALTWWQLADVLDKTGEHIRDTYPFAKLTARQGAEGLKALAASGGDAITI